MSCKYEHLQLLKVPTKDRGVDWWIKMNQVVQKQKFHCEKGNHYYWAEWYRDEVNQPPCPWHS